LDGEAWIGLIWLRIRTYGERFWMRHWTIRFHIVRVISWLDEKLVASQEGLCSMQVTTPDKYPKAWDSVFLQKFLLPSTCLQMPSSATCSSNAFLVLTLLRKVYFREKTGTFVALSVPVYKGYSQNIRQDYRPSSRV
jgi:hypothetical protein